MVAGFVVPGFVVPASAGRGKPCALGFLQCSVVIARLNLSIPEGFSNLAGGMTRPSRDQTVGSDADARRFLRKPRSEEGEYLLTIFND